ncbi:DUF3040 domain-containing protein [Saccharomonospora xinjiangensis]|uniref:DUF3040 domain-containing protein n=1 Tax=Saccharomonospora xinjiangensis XJ-54 TaxID=882086 RepID=I0UYQ9_9PSEU|nr:DUF3040 domain-containing protein [Saccharomonospora xinjiangensis]EID53012.1 Protein of unknown function (DUF3040) [Saccharomonospora xinjiangensis XJ-54]
MALRDDEQRRLAEIERRLSEDDPRLARRLAHLGSAYLSRSIVTFVALCACFVAGLALVAAGTQLRFWPVSIIGIVLAVGVPTVVTWRVWLRGLR